MRNASFAEWILRRVSSPEKAASIVGDLLEADKGPLWFWMAVAGTVIRLAWKRPMAVLVAWLAMEIGTRIFISVGLHNHYPSHHLFLGYFMGIWWSDAIAAYYVRILWSDLMGMCVFAMICSSETRRMVMPTVLFSVFPAIAVCYWLRPTVLIIDVLCAVIAFVALALTRNLRVPLAVILGALAMMVCQAAEATPSWVVEQVSSHFHGVWQSNTGAAVWLSTFYCIDIVFLYFATSIWLRICRWADPVAG